MQNFGVSAKALVGVFEQQETTEWLEGNGGGREQCEIKSGRQAGGGQILWGIIG